MFATRRNQLLLLSQLSEVKVGIARLHGLMLQLLEKDMANQAALDDLTARVAENTDAVSSAKIALEGFVKTNEELTRRLQDAVSNDDSTAIKAASEAIAANNSTLRSAIPIVAAAVPENTPNAR